MTEFDDVVPPLREALQDQKKFLSSNTSEKKRVGAQKESQRKPSKNENLRDKN